MSAQNIHHTKKQPQCNDIISSRCVPLWELRGCVLLTTCPSWDQSVGPTSTADRLSFNSALLVIMREIFWICVGFFSIVWLRCRRRTVAPCGCCLCWCSLPLSWAALVSARCWICWFSGFKPGQVDANSLWLCNSVVGRTFGILTQIHVQNVLSVLA